MTIINMVGGGASGPKVPLNAISVISAVGGNTEATITWTDPSDLVVNGVTVTTWTATKIVRKVGSAPSNSSDGTLVLTETVRNDYSVTGYTDTGLTNGTTYYYAAFAVGDNGLETISSTTPNVIPAQGGWQPGANTLAYYTFNNTLDDSSGNNRHLTGTGSFVNGGPGKVYQVTTAYADDNVFNINGTSPFTICLWVKFLSITTGNYNTVMGFQKPDDIGKHDREININSSGQILGEMWDGSSYSITSGTTVSTNTRYNIVFSYTGSNRYLYINNNLVANGSGGSSRNFNESRLVFNRPYTGYGDSIFQISNAVLENIGRTAQEVSDYYDATKSLYGIS